MLDDTGEMTLPGRELELERGDRDLQRVGAAGRCASCLTLRATRRLVIEPRDRGGKHAAVAVMYVGKLVEVAGTAELYARPKHPYTEALLSAVPKPDPRLRGRGRRIILQGEVADPANPPPGCAFHPRCRYATDRCRTEVPALRDTGGGRMAACHYAEELSLRGAEPATAGTAW